MGDHTPTRWPGGPDVTRHHSPPFRELMIRNISKKVEEAERLVKRAEKLTRPEDLVTAKRIIGIHERQMRGEIVTQEGSAGDATTPSSDPQANGTLSDEGGASGTSTMGSGSDFVMSGALPDPAAEDVDTSELTLEPALLDTPMPSPTSPDPDILDTDIPLSDLPESAPENVDPSELSLDPFLLDTPMPNHASLDFGILDADIPQSDLSESTFMNPPMPDPSPLEAALDDSDAPQFVLSDLASEYVDPFELTFDPALLDTPMPSTAALDFGILDTDIPLFDLLDSAFTDPFRPDPSPLEAVLDRLDVPLLSLMEPDSTNDAMPGPSGREVALRNANLAPAASNQLALMPTEDVDPASENDILGTIYGNEWGGMEPGIELPPRPEASFERFMVLMAPFIPKKLLFMTTMSQFLGQVRLIRRTHYLTCVCVPQPLTLMPNSGNAGADEISTVSIWMPFDSVITGREVPESLVYKEFPVTLEALVHLKAETGVLSQALKTLEKVKRDIEQKLRSRKKRCRRVLDPHRRLLTRGMGSGLRHSIRVDEEWPEGEWGMPYTDPERVRMEWGINWRFYGL